jgi:hypothetical protein
MRGIVVRLAVAALMEIVLALDGAVVYYQLFPLALIGWVIFDITRRVRVVTIHTRIEVPKGIQKQLEKVAKEQMKNFSRQLDEIEKNAGFVRKKADSSDKPAAKPPKPRSNDKKS